MNTSIRGAVELTLSAEHLWDDFKHLRMPGAGTAQQLPTAVAIETAQNLKKV